MNIQRFPRTALKSFIFMSLLVCMVAVALGAVDVWDTWGNNGSIELNYQSGSATDTNTYFDSISEGTFAQPYVMDLDNDGAKEYFVFKSNKLRVYRITDGQFNFVNEITTGKNIWDNSVFEVYDVANFDTSDNLLEIMTVTSGITNSSQKFFEVYAFNGTHVILKKSFQIDYTSGQMGYMRCTVDFDGDGDLDCIFADGHTVSGAGRVHGYDYSASSYTDWSLNLSTTLWTSGDVGQIPAPQFLDANRDGVLDILIVTYQGFAIFNRTAQHTAVVAYSSQMGVKDGIFYQTDVGDYEVVIARGNTARCYPTCYVMNPYCVNNMLLSAYDYDGNLLWDSTACWGLGAGYGQHANQAGCDESGTYSTAGITTSSIEQGTLYLFTGSSYTASLNNTWLCSYHHDGTLLTQHKDSENKYPEGTYVRSGMNARFTQANMLGGSSPEFLSKNLYNINAQVMYGLFSWQLFYWCLPVDLDGDGSLDIICSKGTNTTIMTPMGIGGGGANTKPELVYLGLLDYSPLINTLDEVTLYLVDTDSTHFYYLVDCDYQVGDDVGQTMITYNAPYGFRTDGSDKIVQIGDCGWDTSGVHTIKAWVNDADNGGDTALLSSMSSMERNVTIAEIGNTTCNAPHIFFCERFDYSWDIIYNNWVVSNYYNPTDFAFAPQNNSLRFKNSLMTAYHTFDRHTYPVISVKFNVSVNYTDPFSWFNVMLFGANAQPQVTLKFSQGAVLTETGYCPWTQAPSLNCNFTTTTNNTWHNFVINIYYYDVKGLGGVFLKHANTYDILKDGILVARDLPFYAGANGQDSTVNVTKDGQPLYSFFSNYILFGAYATEQILTQTPIDDVKIDDVYLFKGTSLDHDNTAELSGILEVPQQEEEEITEYWGCYIVNGANKGKFDCTYSKYDCKSCCGTVHGQIVPVKFGCTFFKIGKMWMERFRLWFFRNIWYVFVIGGLALVIVLVVRKVKYGF